MNKKLLLGTVAGAALLGGMVAGIASVASAQTTTGTTSTTAPAGVRGHGFGRMHGMMGRGVAGTVTAVNGSSITITGKNGTSYTVDATNAALSKVVTITATDVKVGDTLGVRGTVSGTAVTATRILDGVPAPHAK